VIVRARSLPLAADAQVVRQRGDEMQLAVNAATPETLHPIGWISLQRDGSISVGLRDRAFVSRRLHSRLDLFNADNRIKLGYLAPNAPDTLRTVANPHLTFHPPMCFHLRAPKDEMQFEGIADVEVMLADQDCVPWIRFVSRPVRDLPISRGPRDPDTVAVDVPVTSDRCSIGLAVDFVRPDSAVPSGRLLDRFADCSQARIRVSCEVLPPQEATLAWIHEC
jgi:hypothetical protein